MTRVLACLFAAAVVAVVAAQTGLPMMGKRTLVITDSSSIQVSHSKFFDLLTARKHELTFKSNTDKVKIIEFGVYQFDNIVILAPTATTLTALPTASLYEFVNNGGNVIVVADERTPEAWALHDFSEECGVHFGAPKSIVIDHSSDSADHITIKSSSYFDSEFAVGDSKNKGPVVYRGIGQSLRPDNILATALLTAPPNAYSAIPSESVSNRVLTGSSLALVTAVQARNNARTLFLGSLYMLSNEAFAEAGSNNKYFANAITKWALQESGVLRATNVRHHKQDGGLPVFQIPDREKPNLPVSMYPDPEVAPHSLVYRINDDLEFQVDVHEFNGEAWVPYKANDMQLEFVMLDPYVRKGMTHDNKGTFTGQFKAPDVYGIYKFRVLYRRPTLSVLDISTQVSVRPFKHNEYERFIGQAFPYYASVLSVMVGFFSFAVYFLYSK